MPGSWLLALARHVFRPAIISAVVEPTIADMRIEWSDPGANASAKALAKFRGYLAFWSLVAISPFAFSRWPEEQVDFRFPRSSEMMAAFRIRLVLILGLAGLGAGYLYGRAQPVLYRSIAILQVVPPKIPDAVLKAPTTIPVADRLRTMEASILSRTRLERLIKEFSLYSEKQVTEIQENVVAQMRGDITTAALKGDVFQVQYTGEDPVTVMKVTERLASLFIEESQKDSQRRLEGTSAFVESEIGSAARRLTEVSADVERAGHSASAMPLRLELEVIQNRYKTLITQREEALSAVNLNRRQIGEQLVLVDRAQVSKEPIGPASMVFALRGGAIGLGVAFLILLGSFLRRVSGGRGDVQGAAA